MQRDDLQEYAEQKGYKVPESYYDWLLKLLENPTKNEHIGKLKIDIGKYKQKGKDMGKLTNKSSQTGKYFSKEQVAMFLFLHFRDSPHIGIIFCFLFDYFILNN